MSGPRRSHRTLRRSLRNQFGQDINVGDWVGYVTRHSSTIERKIGKVVGFGERNIYYRKEPEITVIIEYKAEGTYCRTRGAQPTKGKGTGVGLNTVFKLDAAGLAEFD